MTLDNSEFDLPEAAEFLNMLLDLADPPELPNQDMVTYVEQVEVGMPVEMQLKSHGLERLQLHLSPPTQVTATSVYPVLHKIKIRVKAEKHG